jgi:NADH-quinone oxidoreductase subunit M
LHGAQTGSYSFALFELMHTSVPYGTGLWIFAAFLVALAVKFPLFPLHTWLPDAYCDAPAAGTLVLSSVLAKTAAYSLMRFAFPLLPEAARAFTPLIYAAAVTGILYGAWVALAQTDLKRLIAYSSLSHMGFVALGIAAWTPVALSGAVLQMVNHGITTGALFVLVGLLDERSANREIADYGGIWGTAPVLAFFFLLFNMASAGVPGLNNFVSEFMILVGTFRVAPAAAIGAFLGSVLTLIYTVRLVQGMLFGAERKASCIADLSLREGILLGGLAVLVVYLGVHPAPVLDTIKAPLLLLSGGR